LGKKYAARRLLFVNKDTINKIYILSILLIIFTLPFYLSVPQITPRHSMQYDDLILHAIKKDSRKKIKKLYEENEDYQYLQYNTPYLYDNPKQEIKMLYNQDAPQVAHLGNSWEKNTQVYNQPETYHAQPSPEIEQQLSVPHFIYPLHRHSHEHKRLSKEQRQLMAQQSIQRMKFIQNVMQEQQAKAFEYFKHMMEQGQKLAWRLHQMRMQNKNGDEDKAHEQNA
jgi:hypothetical protein